MIFQVDLHSLGDNALHLVPDLRVSQLALGLALELRVRELHADDGGEALSRVLAGQVGLVFFDQLLLAAVVVHHAG